MAVMTASPRSSDEGYARTRAFYERQGFRLLMEFNEDDPVNPMVCMVLPLPNPLQKSLLLRGVVAAAENEALALVVDWHRRYQTSELPLADDAMPRVRSL